MDLSTDNFQIRLLQPDDLSRVLEIESAVNPHPWTERLFRDELEQPAARLEALCLGETVVGFAVTRCIAGEMEILNIAVAPELHGKGLGRRLLRHVLQQGAEQGLRVVFLEVRAGNAPARNLYTSSGFVEVGCRKGYYRDGEDAILMNLELFKERE